ncbi:hypothetical protein TTHERM_00756380 (macronuclear) [Tetrahymena thermophila SB210]|uniref:Uncharacterized protein n=1 Tax=Tetrahymena thermophila (strain SB210) TaxID=312017 RepID=I7LT20_TETTS|nr:hypothetical protein TTHERM_00756380 [Tetrahymena thermophila SB210]EAR84090.3 hypothetical protein TTHERM_00756380 [Tetrahymena thermophila SB210]|eukprot:XP_001031753.3 hypothetical protein TTHERM_00756380 [Tetrahymena thermophila SB210]
MSKQNTFQQLSDSQQQQQHQQNRGGRFDLDNTIRIKENYIYLYPEIQINKFITQYIEDNQKKFTANHLIEEYLNHFLEEQKNIQLQKMQSYHPEYALKTPNAKIYNIAFYFQEYLHQLPQENTNSNEQKKSVLDLSIGKKQWNDLLAGTNRCIPTNIMEIILSKEHDEEQILALMLLNLYAISNEEIAIELFQIVANLYDPQFITTNEALNKILIQYIVCIILRQNHHNQQTRSRENINQIYSRIQEKYQFTLTDDYVVQFQKPQILQQ